MFEWIKIKDGYFAKDHNVVFVAGKFYRMDGLERIEMKPENVPKELLENLPKESSANEKEVSRPELKNKEPEQEKKRETQRDMQPILPDIFSEELIEKWRKLSLIQRLLMVQHAPRDKIKYRPVGKKPDGTIVKVPYVDGNYMLNCLNFVFLFEWTFEVIKLEKVENGVYCQGILHGTTGLDRPGEGYQESNAELPIGECFKAATTDAIKKAASRLGIAKNVYGDEIE